MAITRIFVEPNPNNKYWKNSSLGILVQAIKKYGWNFIPEKVLPPLFANSLTGVVLYTSYLSALDHENVTVWNTFKAGWIAGSCQSLVAAPIDAIYLRSSTNEILNGKHNNLWQFSWMKLKQIGFIGVFAGFGLSLVKESIGFAFYFSIFESIKNQGFQLTKDLILSYDNLFKRKENHDFKFLKTIYIFVGGITASFTLLSLQYPISKFQNLHYSRLEAFDLFNKNKNWFRLYYHSYLDSFDHLIFIRKNSKLSWFNYLYKGFKLQLLNSLPGMVGGLITLEILRTNLAD